MALKHITAIEAKRLVDQGAILVDVREVNEYADENIPGARNEPLSAHRADLRSPVRLRWCSTASPVRARG